MAAPSPGLCRQRLSLLEDLQKVAQLLTDLSQRVAEARQDAALLDRLNLEIQTARQWETYLLEEFNRHWREHRCG